MGDYFKPWRRKLGVVTLAVACVLAAGWVRSLHSDDVLNLRFHQFGCAIMAMSWSGRVGVGFSTGKHRPGYIEFETSPIDSAEPEYIDERNLGTSFGFVNFGDFGGGGGPINYYGRSVDTYYRMVVIPLTMLSAWLLLSKPRVAQKSVGIATQNVPIR